MINYDLLKNISECLYVNFVSLQNNIRNKDRNINGTFRATAEELLSYINGRHDFVSRDKQGFYNRIINNETFCRFMLEEYKCDSKIMISLHSIRRNGNDTTHNSSKVFDIRDIKNNYKRLLYLAQKVLSFELAIDFSLPNNIEIDEEIDGLFEENLINAGTFDEEATLSQLTALDKDLEKSYLSQKETANFCNEEIVDKMKELMGCLINYIIAKEPDICSLEDMSIGKFSELFKAYKRIGAILGYEDYNDSVSSLINIACIVNDYGRKYRIDCLGCFLDAYEKSKEESSNVDYENIARVIDDIDYERDIQNREGSVYYIESQKSFIVGNNTYYEIDVAPAISFRNKTKISTIYSKDKIPDDYATELRLITKSVKILGEEIDKYFLVDSNIAIRPCEIQNIVKGITGKVIKTDKKDNFYTTLMNYLISNHCNLLDIVLTSDQKYDGFVKAFDDCTSDACRAFLEALTIARGIILKEEEGHNVLRCLLGTMNNRVIKNQTVTGDYHVDNLMLSRGTLYFDDNPFSCSLKKTRLPYSKVAKYIDTDNYRDDIYVKQYEIYCIENQTIFLEVPDEKMAEVRQIIALYNSRINRNKENEMIFLENYLCKRCHLSVLMKILNKIKSNIDVNDGFYDANKGAVLESSELDCENKKEVLLNLFNNSKIAFIQGEAGSGKTELLCNYVTKIFRNKKILFLANTHSALENMRKRVSEKVGEGYNFQFKTVKSIVNEHTGLEDVDILIVDECKTIINSDAAEMFNKISFSYCLLAGDIVQLDAIGIGNWFDVACKIFSGNCHHLTNNHRTKEQSLLELWKKVRENAEGTVDYIKKNGYLRVIGSELLNPKDSDEITLCLGYKDVYGINNINSYFQQKNENPAFKISIFTFKVGDPIIFNDNANYIFSKIIYNNLKGVIRKITENDEEICFRIEIKKYISETAEMKNIDDFKYINGNKSEDWTLIEYTIKKYADNEDDADDVKCVIPFDISYACSIHKAQGLQYRSVKLVVSSGNEKYINREEFYTAITRATERLEIYVANIDDKFLSKLLQTKEESIDAEILSLLFNN